MSAQTTSVNLTHHILIAMPGMEDGLFSKSVIYLCEHSERGALGLIVNKVSDDINLRSLFAKVDLTLGRMDLMDAPVFQGGPVQTERGFVLHDAVSAHDVDEPDATINVDDGVFASTLSIAGGLEMTTSKDVLEALATGAGPKRVLVSLGYSSWAEGQLESEIAENSWLTVGNDAVSTEAMTQVIFDTPIGQRYDKALQLLGLQTWMISPEAGHA